ncbi:MAG: CoA-transferase [Desulfobacteraceae bacterium]
MTDTKLMSLSAAIEALVPDGASVAMCTCYETLIPFAAGHEIIRQQKRNLTLVGPISDMLFDQMIGGNTAAAVRAAWVGNVITGSGYNFRRAVEAGTLEVEDHSNFTISLALTAGAMGVPFMPSRTALGSDLFKTNRSLQKFSCPVTGEPLTAVKAITPDVAIVHVQRADRHGNCHIWGNTGITKEACLASGRIIVTAEEIVEKEVITSDPSRVLFPGFRVSSVVHLPFGGYPSPVPGFYNRDHDAFLEYRTASKTGNQFQQWLEMSVYNTGGLDGYLSLVGRERLDGLEIKTSVKSEGVEYGY